MSVKLVEIAGWPECRVRRLRLKFIVWDRGRRPRSVRRPRPACNGAGSATRHSARPVRHVAAIDGQLSNTWRHKGSLSRRPSTITATAIIAAMPTVSRRGATGPSPMANAALTDLEMGRVQPDVRPLAGAWGRAGSASRTGYRGRDHGSRCGQLPGRRCARGARRR